MAAGTVCLDIVGTLFTLDAPKQALSDSGAPPLTFEVWFSGALRDYFARSHSGAYTPLKDVLQATLPRAARITGWHFDPAVTPDVMQSLRELSPVSGAKAALDQLAEAGWKMIAVTNSSRALVDELLSRGGLSAYFSALISCDDLGMSKPHRRVYQEAKRHAQGEVWLVAAHAWDVAGAIGAGMRAAWVSSGEHIYPEFLPAPDITSHSLSDALDSLRKTH